MYQGRLPVEFRNRTKAFAASAIRLFVKLPKNREEVRVLGKQLLRSGTSVAAQVREASRARSDEEFVSKLGGTLQETDETLLWLELLREECGIPPTNTLPIEKEADELIGDNDPRLLAALDEAIAKADATPGQGNSGRDVRARLNEWTSK